MVRIPHARIEQIIAEDVPYIDLTSMVLGIDSQRGKMEFYTRQDCVLAGVQVVKHIAEQVGCCVISSCEDGETLVAGKTFMTLEGSAADLHVAWKVCLNTFDHLSAVATKTREMVEAAHRGNPSCEILTTRKSMPGVKDLLTEAVLIGGAFPHRLGLSETVLVFDHHMTFLGGFDAFLEQIPSIKTRCVEKKLFVEANAEQALRLVKAGVDGIQLEKIPVEELAALVQAIRQINPHVTLVAAGGINPDNAQAYAATGVDGLATTAPFSASPLDMSVRMLAL
ncbi:ModD protein [Adlercreutzia agrestimuris]|uniref:ModD protein n=1 Tax=Adlercreutzia agrestimuris TaxID=2941324 RepID=UPI00203B375A|nr:ModD protein [Adlercreutzia agrestimuris]